MRKMMTAALLLSGGLTAGAQQIRAGVNLANISTSASGRADEANMRTSFQAGLVGDIKLGTSMLTLQPGILFTGKGAEVQYGTAGQVGYYKQSFRPYYVEVPVNLLLKPPVGGGNRFFFGAGPYVAMGVGGTVRTEGSALLNVNGERSIRFSNDDPTTFNQEEGTGFGIIRRFDYGLNGTAGFEGKHAVVGVNYGLGLAKLQSGANSSADDANKHRVLSFFVGLKL